MYVPEFYFNADSAIFGIIQSSDINENIVSRYFLATRLLPCGPNDAAVKKFTGNDDPGSPPSARDHLTHAIHAFSHFSVVYSQGFLLLCDLQGGGNFVSLTCILVLTSYHRFD